MKQYIDYKIPMRDGTMLSCDIRCLGRSDSYPVILVRTPYNNSELEQRLYDFIMDDYAVVTQDCRGKFDSEGKFYPLHEIEDTVDTVNWINSQPWCNGNIAMVGGSYCGCVQLAGASEKPEGLKAIAPMVFSGNPYFSGVYEDNIPRLSDILFWATKVTGHSLQSNITTDWIAAIKHLPLSEMDRAAGYDISYMQEWFKHESFDSFWQGINYNCGLQSSDIPTLFFTGWYDAFYKGTLQTFELMQDYRKLNNIDTPLKMIIGPWTHNCDPAMAGDLYFGSKADIDLLGIEKKWNDYFLKSKSCSFIKELPVKYFTMGLNDWQESNCWPPENISKQTLYLESNGKAAIDIQDGKLVAEPCKAAESDSYIYDPANPVITVGGNVLDEKVCQNGPRNQYDVEYRNDVLTYTTEPLKKDLEITGYIEAVLYIKSSAVDTDFFVRLCDVRPDGESYNLCNGAVRMKFRDGDDKIVLMNSDEIYKVEFRAGATSNLFKKGHSIRIQISSSNFPEYARNLNTGEDIYSASDFIAAKQTIYHSEEYPSKIILPVV